MRRLALALTAAATLGAAPAVGHAVVAGVNGPIVFTSGRGGAPGNDDNAKIWMTGSELGGGAIQLTTGSTRHSHPAWSPDRTKVAYARSRAGAGARDIYVRDLITGNELQLTNTMAEDEDRPAWSPDGTEIAYGQAPNDTFGTPRDIFIRPSTGGAPRNLAILSVASEDKPVWSPDGQFIYYARDTVPSTNADIVRELADNTSPNPIPVVASSANEWQPNLSPDGSRLCYSLGGMSDSGMSGVDVYTADADGLDSNVDGFATSTTQGEFNCVWSPDGSKILFVRGVFTGGDLVVAPYPGPGGAQEVPGVNVDSHFDGNPDWINNPVPVCANENAAVGFNGFVRISLSCSDDPDPPSFQPNPPDLALATGPSNGTLGGISDDRSVIYTPNANFQGTDSFTFTGADGTSTTAPATISITVAGPGADTAAPVITRVRVSRRRWRRGPGLPAEVSARVGTRISWRLSEAARTTLTFQRARPGRRVGGRCRPATRARRARPRCKRFVRVRPALRVPNADTGSNAIRFQGRLTRRKRLGLGTYRVLVGATDAAGNRARRRTSRTFRIVAR